MEQMQFKVSSALKDLVGKDLITNDNVAIFELVKNSYDAYATKVEIKFSDNEIVIADNGKGMSFDDLKNKWLFLGYSAKKDGTEDADNDVKQKSYRDKIKRHYAGAKGIGRFSCDRLGKRLSLTTKSEDSLNVGNAKLQKTSSNTSITVGNGIYSIAGATYGVFSDKDCTKQLATLTTDENGNTDVVEVTAGTVYIKEVSAPAGYKVDKTVYSLKIEAGKIATLKVSDIPKVTDTLTELFKNDMETQKDNPQG